MSQNIIPVERCPESVIEDATELDDSCADQRKRRFNRSVIDVEMMVCDKIG